jgi:predicted nucleic acid-binding protein
MGMIELGGASHIYADSNVFIYAVEGRAEIADPLQELLDLLRSRPGFAATSELTLAEVLAKVDVVQRRDYLDLIVESGVFQLCSVSRDILIETASYRRAVGMPKLVDAIHVVTAIRNGCRTMLSADLRMKAPGISIVDANSESLSRLIRELS